MAKYSEYKEKNDLSTRLLQIRVKWLVVMMRGKVAANEWWVRGECNGFELHFPLGT